MGNMHQDRRTVSGRGEVHRDPERENEDSWKERVERRRGE